MDVDLRPQRLRCGACLLLTGRVNDHSKQHDKRKDAKEYDAEVRKEVEATPLSRPFKFSKVKEASLIMNDLMNKQVEEVPSSYWIAR